MITCGFVGLGLIGGSIARALKANRKDIVIIACDPNEETLKLATEQKIADEAYPAPCDAFTACDYIFLCAPVSHNDENLLKILSYRKKDCILTDVGSVKTPINSLIHSLGLTDCFIGGHPMAGSERIGFANSKAGLLENAYYILAPAPQVPAAKIAEFQGLVTSMGAIPLQVESQKHDYVTAAVSHLPHIVAAALVHLVQDHDDAQGLMKSIAAGGFKDITRIEPIFEEMVDFDTFAKSDFRAVKILACEAVPKSKKLLKFTLDDGERKDRVILSGIHEYYEPEELVGKTAIAIVNLAPRKMMGIDSEGMLISAVHEEDGHEGLNLLMVNDRIPAGAKLY